MSRRLRAARIALAAVIFALGSGRIAADVGVGVKLRLLETLTRVADGDWALATLGTARLSAAASSESVKAELAVDALLGEGIVTSLARASIAVRFPSFRLTLGKARLSWGEGAAFNAADLLFAATSTLGLDLTADTLRDDAAWLASAYVPLGRFSFVEAVALPPPVDVVELVENPLAPLPDPADLAIGGRVVGKILGIKTEAAYLFRGAERAHRVAASLQGNLFVDWHLSAALRVPAITPTAQDALDSIRVSFGLFHLQRLGSSASLAMRLEGLLAPAGSWQEEEPPVVPGYGLLLYPELSLNLDSLSVNARCLVSPLDGSALLVPGVTLSLHKGLSFLGMASIAVGDATDTWSFSRAGGLSFLLGCRYTY